MRMPASSDDASGSRGGVEMGRLLGAFAEADASGSGVDAAALQAVVRRMGLSSAGEMGLTRLLGEVEHDGSGRVTYDALVACLVRHGWQPEIQRPPAQSFATESVSRTDYKPYALPMRVARCERPDRATLSTSPEPFKGTTTSRDAYRPWPLPPPLPESPYVVGGGAGPSAIAITPSTSSPVRLHEGKAASREGSYRPWPIQPPPLLPDSPYAVMDMPAAGSPSKLIHAEQLRTRNSFEQPRFEGVSVAHELHRAPAADAHRRAAERRARHLADAGHGRARH